MLYKTGFLLLLLSICWSLSVVNAQTRLFNTELDNPLAEKAVEWQHIAFIAEALQNDFKSALAATDSALLLWDKLGAQPEIAKLNRYRGLLLARLNRYSEAKLALCRAKSMFEQQKAVYGLALTHYEWGRVCLLARELDSAQYYTQIALSSWQLEKHDSRLFQAKVQLLYLYARQFNFPDAERLQVELDESLMRFPIDRLKKLDYWYVKRYFSEKKLDWSAYEQYNHEYVALIAAFAAEGSTVVSFYSLLGEKIPQN